MDLGYLRKSRITVASPGAVSAADQEAAIRRMAGESVELLIDWGMSGGKRDRPGWVRLRAAVASGQVGVVYSYDFSRLGRDLPETLDFLKLCEANQTIVRTAKDGELTNLGATGSLLRDILGRINQWQRELSEERSKESNGSRKARGDAMGSAGYGYQFVRRDGRVVRDPDDAAAATVQAVVDAYRETGTILGACKRLNAAGVKPPRGSRWWTRTVTRIIGTETPAALPPRSAGKGRRERSGAALLSKLLRCHCDATMTPKTSGGYQSYYCSHGSVSDRANHPRLNVTESHLLPWLKAEAARLRVPGDSVLLAEAATGRSEAIRGRLERATELYLAGDPNMDRARYDVEKKSAGDALAALEAEASVVDLPGTVDWSWPPEQLNAVLRAIWRYVELDSDMRPTRAEWLVPEWRG